MKKMFKRIGALVVSVALLVSCGSMVAFAEDSSGLEAAILSAKSRIYVPEELSEFDSNTSTYEDKVQYNLNWYDKEGNNSLSITINDKNDIIYYSQYRNTDYDRKTQFAKYSNEQLLDIAYEWLAKVNPDWVAELPRDMVELSKTSDIYNGRQNILIYRYVNGIPYLGNYVSFSMNNRTGDIRNMNSNWAYETEIPNPSEAFGVDKAAEEYFKLSPLELIYISGDENTAKLVYMPQNPYVRINARRGNEINEVEYNEYGADKEEAAMNTMASGGGAAGDRVELTESEIKNLEEIEGLISREELEKKARGLYNTGLDKAVFESCEYRRGYKAVPIPYSEEEEEKESYIANLSFVIDKDTENQANGSVEFDAETGEILSYYSWDNNYYYSSDKKNENKKPAVSVADAEQTARKFAEQNSEGRIDKTKVVDVPEEVYGRDYYFNFVRFENDIPFAENGINIEVDSENGRVLSYRKHWNDTITFENPDGVLSIEEAEAAFCKNIGFELSYDYDYIKEDKKTVVELTYTADGKHGFALNAKTGEYEYEEYEEINITEPDDISGHYAEDKIKALLYAGMIDMGKETSFRPDDAITHGELAVMVGRLMNRYYGPVAKEDMLSAVRGWGIVLKEENFDSDAEAARVYGPKYIIRALGYREVAELPDTYTCNFADADKIPADMLGYVALAKGFGIVGGDENRCFNADETLTRADAAIMVYNYLAR